MNELLLVKETKKQTKFVWNQNNIHTRTYFNKKKGLNHGGFSVVKNR